MNPPAPVTKISCDICMVAPVMDQQPERHDSMKREPHWLNHALHFRAGVARAVPAHCSGFMVLTTCKCDMDS